MQQLSCNNIEDLKQVKDFSALKSLSLTQFQHASQYEPYLLKCINLERLEMHWGTMLSNKVFKLPKLQHLIIKNTTFITSIPNEIGLLTNLRMLEVSREYLTDISENISYLSKLEELNLNHNTLTELPETLDELTKLRHLDIMGNRLSQFPAIVLELPKLNELFFKKKWFTILCKKHPTALKRIPYVFSHTPLEKKYGRTLLYICRKNNYDWEFRAVLFNLLANNIEKLKELATLDQLLAATDVLTVETVRLKALDYIGQLVNPDYKKTLIKGAKLAVVGKLGIKKPELRAKLKEHGIKYGPKVDCQTTHLLVGQMPKQEYQAAKKKGIPIITEKNILSYLEELNNPYLLTGDKEELVQNEENIASLLVSGLDDSIKIALALFKEGGFPKGLITELFVAKALNSSKEVLREIDRLYLQYGSPELISLTKRSLSVFNKHASETNIKTKVSKLAKHTEIDGVKLAKYIYARTGKGRNYLIYNLPSEEKIAFLKEKFLHGKKLSLFSLGLNSIPKEIYQLTEVEELMLQYNRIKSISKKLSNFSTLKLLDIRNNVDLYPKLAEIQALVPNCKILT
ncbi:MAG: hypothetical protein GY810_31495 [Aureispira sp.]|nr:hypothetical protein [Aureispira sp.]